MRSDFDAKFPRLLGVEVSKFGVRFRVMAQRVDIGLDEFAVSHDQSTVALLWNLKGRSELQILTLPDQTLHPPVELPGEVASDLSISAAGSVVSVTVSSPQHSPLVHLIDVANRTVTPVRDDVVTGEGPPSSLLRPPELVEFFARDGMPLSGFLYRSAKKSRDERPGPTLLYFHGGPRGPDPTGLPVPLRAPLVDAGITVFAPPTSADRRATDASSPTPTTGTAATRASTTPRIARNCCAGWVSPIRTRCTVRAAPTAAT